MLDDSMLDDVSVIGSILPRFESDEKTKAAVRRIGRPVGNARHLAQAGGGIRVDTVVRADRFSLRQLGAEQVPVGLAAKGVDGADHRLAAGIRTTGYTRCIATVAGADVGARRDRPAAELDVEASGVEPP